MSPIYKRKTSIYKRKLVLLVVWTYHSSLYGKNSRSDGISCTSINMYGIIPLWKEYFIVHCSSKYTILSGAAFEAISTYVSSSRKDRCTTDIGEDLRKLTDLHTRSVWVYDEYIQKPAFRNFICGLTMYLSKW